MSTFRELIMRQFSYCEAIADDIINHNASEEVIKYAKKYAEIESPMTEETDAAWVRVNWGDIYIFIHFDEDLYLNERKISFTGKITYQVDAIGGYGGELIDVNGIESFIGALNNITEKEILEHYKYVFPENYVFDGDYSKFITDDVPKYTPL